MKRAILIVLDSLGVGALPDAKNYGDLGANTLLHILEQMPTMDLKNLRALGLANIEGLSPLQPVAAPSGSFGRMAELSTGKDTITGHWEIGGLLTQVPFKTFPTFPKVFMEAYEKAIGRGTLGNYAASGTEIIKELGEEHRRTKKPIIYTSADSVFQIACDVNVVPLELLYRFCEIARAMLIGDLQVGRVIARPFTYKEGVYERTSDRKDYAVSPGGKTMLDSVADSKKTVCAIGKISDIFNGCGVTRSIHTTGNMDGVEATIKALKQEFSGLIFTNLVDFDSKYGHRREPLGYGQALLEFDAKLPFIMSAMQAEDVLFLCADHGNDPVHSGWDHTREYVPVLAYGKPFQCGVDLGTRTTFADLGATICEYLEVEKTVIGQSFLCELQR